MTMEETNYLLTTMDTKDTKDCTRYLTVIGDFRPSSLVSFVNFVVKALCSLALESHPRGSMLRQAAGRATGGHIPPFARGAMAHEYLQLKLVHKSTGYSHAAKVGNMLYIAGQVSMDRTGKVVGKGDITIQVKQVYANLANILKEAGGSLTNIVKMTTYLTHHRYLEPYRAVRGTVFKEPYPANTLLVVESLADPDFMIEIEAIAALDK
jgi:enamine deaminase RidA (YjgF/YER057c/UK114 family)